MMFSVHRLHRVEETPPQRSILCQGIIIVDYLDENRQATHNPENDNIVKAKD